VVFERVLDPVRRVEDRGLQEVAVPLPPGANGRLDLCVASAGTGDPSRDWGFLTGVAFEVEPARSDLPR
jgi:hypothetical protein